MTAQRHVAAAAAAVTANQRCTDKALYDYRSADNRCLTIGQLPINTKNYKNLTFLPVDIEKVADRDSCIMNYSKTCFWRPTIR